MNTTCEVLQRERMAYISKCAYREIRKMIPDSLDKPLMDTGLHFGGFHYMAVYQIMMEHGTEWEKEYMTHTILDYFDNATSIEIGFTGGYAYRLIRLMGDTMHPHLKERFLTLIEEGLDELAYGHHAFTGVNDNFPSWDVLIGAYAYKFSGKKEYYDLMYPRLVKFCNRLRRTTDSSEYNSPTYLQVTLENMADIVELLGRDDPMAIVAQEILDRLVYSMLVRYHKDLHVEAGPFGRAYNVDSVGHVHHMSFILYMLLGDEYMDIPEIIYGTEYYEDGHIIHGDRPYYMLNFYNGTRVPYHVSEEVEKKYRALPQYPYVFEGSAEVSSSGDFQTCPVNNFDTYPRTSMLTNEVFEYAAGTCNLYTYMGEGYTLATADKEFHNGIQTESFFYTGRADNGETATIFARMLTNGAEPYYYRFPLLNEEGRKIGIQSQNSAMVLYHLRGLKALQPGFRQEDTTEKIDNAKLSLLIYNHFDVVDDVKQVGNDVFVRIGKQYIMFAPLNTDSLEKVTVEDVNRFKMINFHLRIDEEKNMYRRGRTLNVSGFVCEVRDVKDYADMDDFIKDVSDYKVVDYLYSNRDCRMTVMREAEYDSKRVHLEIGTSVVSEGIFYKEIYRKDDVDCVIVK